MEHVDPDIKWYTGASTEKGLPPRCPFATTEACPRFYQSLSLLGSAGSTSIDEEEDRRLKEKWQASDLWPRAEEQATGIASTGDRTMRKTVQFWNFCPEVTYERFGFFASYLGRYADELDLEQAHERLGTLGVPGSDWRWAWASVSAMHYSECPLYSILEHRSHSTTHPGRTTTRREAGTAREEPVAPDWVSRLLARISRHPVVASVLALGAAIIALASFTDAVGSLVALLGGLIP